jgi:hypothetical protein
VVHNMSSNLFAEALADAKQLRELATEQAKERLMRELAPQIRRMIAEESRDEFFVEQDEEQEEVAPPGAPVAPTGQAAAPTSPDLGDQATEAPVQAPEEESTLSATMPDEEGKITVDFTDLFVDDGSVTLDLSQLPPVPGAVETQPPAPAPEPAFQGPEFTPGPEEEEEEEEPAPVGPPVSGESLSYPEWQAVYAETAHRVDRLLFSSTKPTKLTLETIKHRLMDLLESVDLLRNSGGMTTRLAKKHELQLEFLFLKLKEARMHNSYPRKDGDDSMKSLKEYAAMLFEEEENLAQDSVSTGDTGLAVDGEASEHAEKVSGVQPGVDLTEDTGGAGVAGSVDEPPISEEMPGEVPWEDGQEPLAEASTEDGADEAGANENVAKGAAGFGDTTETPEARPFEESLVFEVSDAELIEAIRSVRKEAIKKKIRKLRESDLQTDVEEDSSWEEGEPEGGSDPSHEKLEEQAKRRRRRAKLKEMDMKRAPLHEDTGDDSDDDVLMVDDEDLADLVVSIDLPPEVEAELASMGEEEVEVDVAVGAAGGEESEGDEADDLLDLGGLGDEDGSSEVEDVLDVDDLDMIEDAEAEAEEGSEEEDMMLSDDSMYESIRRRHRARQKERADKSSGRTQARMRMLEARSLRLRRHVAKLQGQLKRKPAGVPSKAVVTENARLKRELADTNLFTARVVYYSKFLQRALSEAALTKKALQQIAEHLDRGKTVAETKAIYKKISQRLNEHLAASQKLGGSSSSATKSGSATLTEGRQDQQVQVPTSQVLGSDLSGVVLDTSRWQKIAGIDGSRQGK